MSAEPPGFDLERILTTLDRHDVEYLLVGGLGARAHGATRPTQDVDFVPHSTRENLDRLAGELRELGARLRMAPRRTRSTRRPCRLGMDSTDETPGRSPDAGTNISLVQPRKLMFRRCAGTIARSSEHPPRWLSHCSTPPTTVIEHPQAANAECAATAGTMYGMSRKTTVYFPDELKAAIERAAVRRQLSEAEVIRQAVASALRAPRPTPGLLEVEPFAERTDELLAGFGSR
jgi:hypothetical protein